MPPKNEKHQKKTKGTSDTISKIKPSQPKVRLEPTIEPEKIAKIRSSRYERFSRYSNIKVSEEDFYIRKALNTYVVENLQSRGRNTYFQRVFILARNVELPPDVDFRLSFQQALDKIVLHCEKTKHSSDSLAGLYVCMDKYSFLMIESDQDMVGHFLILLVDIVDSFWQECKIFMVDDNIAETYLDSMYSKRSPGININEKFSPATSNEFLLMSVQHISLREKIRKLCNSFSHQVKNSSESEMEGDTLPAEPYNRLLPEIQRIELVLKANKYYMDLQSFIKTYIEIPLFQDEDSMFWPIQNNYTPKDIFERSEYDVNLTFADYGQVKDKKAEETDKSEETT